MNLFDKLTPNSIIRFLKYLITIFYSLLFHFFDEIWIYQQIKTDISYIKKLFCEFIKTANGELSRTAYQSLEEVKRNDTIRNMEKKTEFFFFFNRVATNWRLKNKDTIQ